MGRVTSMYLKLKIGSSCYVNSESNDLNAFKKDIAEAEALEREGLILTYDMHKASDSGKVDIFKIERLE